MHAEPHDEAHLTAEAVARRSRSRLVALLAARFRDLEAAEDALSEAFAAALSNWPQTGCPANPEAWLLTAARRKLIDQMRRRHETADSEELEHLADSFRAFELAGFPDRRLALLFACTHPAIASAIRAPLILQVVLGLDVSAIASAFLTSPAAMAQRLVRAKAKIRDSGIPFAIPEVAELPERVDAVLDSIYACFSEGWTDPGGADIARREFATEAIFLGKLLAEVLPGEPEALGLLALMLYTEARRKARRTGDGQYVPLRGQDRALWDESMIEEAEATLRRAARSGRMGRYQIEAAIQSAHIAGARSGSTSWTAVLSLYDALVSLTGSPVARINRALAVAEVHGPKAGLAALGAVAGDRRVETYQPYWAVRAHLLAVTGSSVAAREAYQIAIRLEPDPAIQQYLVGQCGKLPEPDGAGKMVSS